MIFDLELKWDSLSIESAIRDFLEKEGWNVTTSMGFSNEGQSAFIDTARKKKFVVIIYLENDDQQIRIKGGIDGKYLPKGKQIPKYSKIFAHTELIQASKYFEEMLEEMK